MTNLPLPLDLTPEPTVEREVAAVADVPLPAAPAPESERSASDPARTPALPPQEPAASPASPAPPLAPTAPSAPSIEPEIVVVRGAPETGEIEVHVRWGEVRTIGRAPMAQGLAGAVTGVARRVTTSRRRHRRHPWLGAHDRDDGRPALRRRSRARPHREPRLAPRVGLGEEPDRGRSARHPRCLGAPPSRARSRAGSGRRSSIGLGGADTPARAPCFRGDRKLLLDTLDETGRLRTFHQRDVRDHLVVGAFVRR